MELLLENQTRNDETETDISRKEVVFAISARGRKYLFGVSRSLSRSGVVSEGMALIDDLAERGLIDQDIEPSEIEVVAASRNEADFYRIARPSGGWVEAMPAPAPRFSP